MAWKPARSGGSSGDRLRVHPDGHVGGMWCCGFRASVTRMAGVGRARSTGDPFPPPRCRAGVLSLSPGHEARSRQVQARLSPHRDPGTQALGLSFRTLQTGRARNLCCLGLPRGRGNASRKAAPTQTALRRVDRQKGSSLPLQYPLPSQPPVPTQPPPEALAASHQSPAKPRVSSSPPSTEEQYPDLLTVISSTSPIQIYTNSRRATGTNTKRY